MSKAVLISIQPKWCELIANGKKTVEVRKTRPKLKTPFKVYIYCSQEKRLLRKFDKGERIDDSKGNGRTMGVYRYMRTEYVKFAELYLMCREKDDHKMVGMIEAVVNQANAICGDVEEPAQYMSIDEFIKLKKKTAPMA